MACGTLPILVLIILLLVSIIIIIITILILTLILLILLRDARVGLVPGIPSELVKVACLIADVDADLSYVRPNAAQVAVPVFSEDHSRAPVCDRVAVGRPDRLLVAHRRPHEELWVPG